MTQIITTGTTPKALWPGIAYWWGQSYDEHEPEWIDLFDQETSGKAYEEVVESIGFGLPRAKAETDSITYDTTGQGFTTRFTHVAYALGFMVSQEEMRDNLYAEVGKRRAGDLAFSMRQGHEIVAANFYNTGFSKNGADGVPWFSASHSTYTGNQSNLLASADISEAALEDAVIAVMSTVDSRGRKIPLRAMSIHVAPANWFETTRILKSVLQNDTALNAVNALKITGEFPNGIKVNHYFDDPDAYFIRTNARRGAMHFQRDPIEFQEDSSYDNLVQKYRAYERFSVGRADFRGCFASPGA